MLALLLLVLTIVLVIYIKLKYFTLRGPVPGLPPHFFFGNLIQSGLLFHGVTFPQVFASFKDRFGDIYQFWIGFSRAIVVSDIDDIQHIFTHRNIYDQGDVFVEKFSVLIPDGLICNKGAKFKRHAALTMPLFRRGKIISNLDLIIDCTEKLLDHWRTSPSQHVHVSIVQQCQNLMLEIFGLIAFDYDLETLSGANNNELTSALRDILNAFDIVIYSPRIVSTIYLKLSGRYQRAMATIRQHLYRMMEQELAESAQSRAQRKRTSLIASLVGSLQTDEKAEARKSEEERKGLSRRELFDEMLLFLIAGFETTSTALAWSIHLLSKHPRVQHKIKAELMSDNIKQGLSLDRLDSLVYLDCVINEILRFSPAIDGTNRTLTVDDRLPKSGTQLYQGDLILVPTCVVSRDTRHWSIDPELFYPERFLGEDKNHHPYAFLPFGSGHRQCIGQDLARFELKAIIARLMQRVTFADGGPEVNAGGQLKRLTVMPKHVGVIIGFD